MNDLSYIESIGHLFYLVSPNRTSFEKVSEVPRYFENASSKLYALFLIEVCLAWYTKRSKIVFTETLANVSQAVLLQLFALLMPIAQMAIYDQIYEHNRLISLPWNSAWTWWITLLTFDFMYYWMHRLVHVVNILWATHHTHHSAEYYNIATNFRQNFTQLIGHWIFFLPAALFVPSPIFYAHSAFNTLYQFWVHTECVKSLGPLEYIFNTPSHHRVHHGRNRKYIDKNFGGFLIIWDRMFGTFEAESEDVVYGVTTPANSFDLITLQVQPFIEIWCNFWKYKGIKNKLSVLFKGPGWTPGKPWCGVVEDIPNVKAPQPKYEVRLSFWCKIYVICQFFVLVSGHSQLMRLNFRLPNSVFYCAIFYEVFSLISIGFILDKRSYFPKFELARCLLHFALDHNLKNTELTLTWLQAKWISETYIEIFHMVSFSIWLIYCTLKPSMKKESAPVSSNQVQNIHSEKLLYVD